jgi:hypothetical protein
VKTLAATVAVLLSACGPESATTEICVDTKNEVRVFDGECRSAMPDRVWLHAPNPVPEIGEKVVQR